MVCPAFCQPPHTSRPCWYPSSLARSCSADLAPSLPPLRPPVGRGFISLLWGRFPSISGTVLDPRAGRRLLRRVLSGAALLPRSPSAWSLLRPGGSSARPRFPGFVHNFRRPPLRKGGFLRALDPHTSPRYPAALSEPVGSGPGASRRFPWLARDGGSGLASGSWLAREYPRTQKGPRGVPPGALLFYSPSRLTTA